MAGEATDAKASGVRSWSGTLGSEIGRHYYHFFSHAPGAGALTNSPIMSMRWTSSSELFVLQKVVASFEITGTAFTAGQGNIRLSVARSFSASDTGGSTFTPTKLRAGDGASAVGDMRSGALTAGTRTLDAWPLGAAPTQLNASDTYTNAYLNATLFDINSTDTKHGLVLTASEGIVVDLTVPATGTYVVRVLTMWREVTGTA